jgi:hypothetical protein
MKEEVNTPHPGAHRFLFDFFRGALTTGVNAFLAGEPAWLWRFRCRPFFAVGWLVVSSSFSGDHQSVAQAPIRDSLEGEVHEDIGA